MRFTKAILIIGVLTLISATPLAADMAPIKPVEKVDLQRFMGPWYVIASIPSALEKKAYNAVETYRLAPNGHIDTVAPVCVDGCRVQHRFGYSRLPRCRRWLEALATRHLSGLHGRRTDTSTLLGA
jgi:lipocalin